MFLSLGRNGVNVYLLDLQIHGDLPKQTADVCKFGVDFTSRLLKGLHPLQVDHASLIFITENDKVKMEKKQKKIKLLIKFVNSNFSVIIQKTRKIC